MTDVKLNAFRSSRSEREWAIIYSKWLLFAESLLRKYKKTALTTAEDVVNDTYIMIGMNADGHKCPDDVPIEQFFAEKIETAVSRLSQQQRRAQMKHVEIDAVSNMAPASTPDIPRHVAELVHDGVVAINKTLEVKKVGLGMRVYVRAMPTIIEKDFTAEQAARFVGVKDPKMLATYRNRIRSHMGLPPEKTKKK